jgi:hypothetical protein
VQQYNWTGTLNQWQAQSISLPVIQLAAGNHTFTATVSNPNQTLDENASNNQSVANLVVTAIPETIDILKVTLTTDDYANETYVELHNASGAIVWSEGNEAVSGNFGTGVFPAPTDPTTPLQNNTTYNYDIPLTAFECYTFVIYDYYGDGMGASQWGGTDGALTLADNNAVTIYTLPAADFGDSTGAIVRHIENASLDEVALNLTIAPNPAGAELFVNWFKDAQMHIQLFDVCGKQLLSLKQEASATTLDIQGLCAGTYLLQLTDASGRVVKQKFVKQ